MSKAQKIRELYAKGLTTAQIAKRVGCLDSYVRVCARQRVDGKPSEHDRNFWRSKGCESQYEYRLYYRKRRAKAAA